MEYSKSSYAQLSDTLEETRAVAFRVTPDWTRASWVPPDLPAPDREMIDSLFTADAQAPAPAPHPAGGRRQFSLIHSLSAPDGTLRWALVVAVPIFDAGGTLTEWLCTLTDTTAARQRQERAAWLAERQSFLLSLADNLRELGSPRCIMLMAARALGERLACGRVRYVDLDRARVTFAASAEWTDAARGIQPLADRFSLSQIGSPLLAHLRRGQVLRIDDVRSDPLIRPAAIP